jgi:hypothetical protein
LQALVLEVVLRVTMFSQQSRAAVQQVHLRPLHLLPRQVRHNVLLHRGLLQELEMK